MKSRHSITPAETVYRLDRTIRNGEVYKWYGQETYTTRKAAESAIIKRFSKYQDQMTVVKVELPDRDTWTLY